MSRNNNIYYGNYETYHVNNSIIIGSNNTVYGHNNTIQGSNSTVYGNNNTIQGSNNDVRGNNNTIQGSNNDVKGNNNQAYGSDNDMQGNNNQSYGNNSFGKSYSNKGVTSFNISGNDIWNRCFGKTIAFANTFTNDDDIYVNDLPISNINGVPVSNNIKQEKESKSTIVPAPEQEQEGEYPEELQCIVCYSRKKNTICDPCMHMAYCVTCAISSQTINNILSCPVCRTAVKEIKKVYL